MCTMYTTQNISIIFFFMYAMCTQYLQVKKKLLITLVLFADPPVC